METYSSVCRWVLACKNTQIKHTTTDAGQSGVMGLSPMRVVMCQQISQTVEVKIVRSQLDITLTGELFDILVLFHIKCGLEFMPDFTHSFAMKLHQVSYKTKNVFH